MARPLKQGLDYFPFNIDFFQNLKVRRIVKACGPTSPTVLICLLCNIYRDKGYYIEWDNDLPFSIADIIGMAEGAVDEVIKKAIQVEFFDKELFDRYQILTSEDIQSRYLGATERRTGVEWNPDFMVNEVKNIVFANKNEVNENRSTQIKENKRKEKTSPEKKSGDSINSKARTLFEKHFSDTFGSSYYWTSKDAGNMTQLLNKLKHQRKEKKLPTEDEDILNALDYFLKAINDGWLFENFTVPNLNSQFNNVLIQIKKTKSGNKHESHVYK